MATATPPPFQNDWRAQRRVLRDQARAQRMYLRGLRRSSIVGPLLVVALGVVFLLVQVGRIPGVPLWMAFAHWWPLLLIAVGTICLIEWFIDQRTRTALPLGTPFASRGLGAGASFLLVSLTLAGIASSISREHAQHIFGQEFQLNQDNLEEFFGNKHESTETRSVPCPGEAVLSISNPRGNVVVTGTSDDGQLHWTADNQVYSRSDSDAARKAETLAVRLERSGNQLSLTIPAVEGARVDLTVRVPGSASVTVTANRGDVQLHSLQAGVTATANHGDVEVSSITGSLVAHVNHGDSSLSAHNISGDVTIEGRSLDLTLSDISGAISLNGEFFGTTHLERTAGPLHFHTSRTDLQLARLDGELEMTPHADLTADQIVGPLILNTRNRNITLERVVGSISVTNRNGSVAVTAAQPLGNVMIENRNGSVDLTLPTDAAFNVQAETSNGDLNNDFGLNATEDGDQSKLAATVGHGGAALQLSTSQADLSIHKGVIAPLLPKLPVPPTPPAPPHLPHLPATPRLTLTPSGR